MNDKTYQFPKNIPIMSVSVSQKSITEKPKGYPGLYPPSVPNGGRHPKTAFIEQIGPDARCTETYLKFQDGGMVQWRAKLWAHFVLDNIDFHLEYISEWDASKKSALKTVYAHALIHLETLLGKRPVPRIYLDSDVLPAPAKPLHIEERVKNLPKSASGFAGLQPPECVRADAREEFRRLVNRVCNKGWCTQTLFWQGDRCKMELQFHLKLFDLEARFCSQIVSQWCTVATDAQQIAYSHAADQLEFMLQRVVLEEPAEEDPLEHELELLDDDAAADLDDLAGALDSRGLTELTTFSGLNNFLFIDSKLKGRDWFSSLTKEVSEFGNIWAKWTSFELGAEAAVLAREERGRRVVVITQDETAYSYCNKRHCLQNTNRGIYLRAIHPNKNYDLDGLTAFLRGELLDPRICVHNGMVKKLLTRGDIVVEHPSAITNNADL